MRVVAGRWGGRRLVAPRESTTRPTSEKVREALFSVLGPVDGMRVADLFAGTGALGLEALSRGASSALFVESNRQAHAALTTNVRALGALDVVQIIARPLERSIAAVVAAGPFDLLLVDPPYALVDTGVVARLLHELCSRGALAPGATLVLEHAATSTPPTIASLELEQTRRYGDTSVSLYASPEPPTDNPPDP